MWKLEKRKRRVTYESIAREDWIDCETLVRDDGVSLMVMGGAPEKHLIFLYTDENLSFDFLATRFRGSDDPFATDASLATDTWIVKLGSALNRLENMQRKTATQDQLKHIADNIQEALLAWPIYADEKELPPVTKVIFRLSPWRHWSPALGWGE